MAARLPEDTGNLHVLSQGGASMTIFDPPRPGTATWQLPWLRVTLILRTMTANPRCRDEDLADLLAVRRRLAQDGWFN